LSQLSDVVQVQEERVRRWSEAQSLLEHLVELFLQRFVGSDHLLQFILGQLLEVLHDLLPEAEEVTDFLDEGDFQLVEAIPSLLVHQKGGQLAVVVLDRCEVLDHLILLVLVGANADRIVELFDLESFAD